jgi:zinc transporter ZupT
LVPALLPLTAANFLYIALAILLPELQRERDSRRSAIQAVCLLASVALMCALSKYAHD